MDAHLIGIDLGHFLPIRNPSATKRQPVKPPKTAAESVKESSTVSS